METKQTAIERLASLIIGSSSLPYNVIDTYIVEAKTLEIQNAIAFHKWMKKNDIAENAEQYFGYTDENMYDEWIKSQNRYKWTLTTK